MLKEIRITVAWGEQAKALCPFALDGQFLVDGEWLVSTRGEIIQHCPEGGYPDGVAYVSAGLCEDETRKSFFRTINYGLDTLKGGISTFYTWVNSRPIDKSDIAIQALNAAVKKYGIKTCLSKKDVDEILEQTVAENSLNKEEE